MVNADRHFKVLHAYYFCFNCGKFSKKLTCRKWIMWHRNTRAQKLRLAPEEHKAHSACQARENIEHQVCEAQEHVGSKAHEAQKHIEQKHARHETHQARVYVGSSVLSLFRYTNKVLKKVLLLLYKVWCAVSYYWALLKFENTHHVAIKLF